MKQKVFKAGNSKVVVVPASFAEAVGVRVGDVVEVRQEPEKGVLAYHFEGVKQLKFNSVKR